MGIKFLNLQILPWCFQLMGNQFQDCDCDEFDQVNRDPPSSPQTDIKLIKPDGVVKVYDRPIMVSELMLEFPKHLVCASNSFYIGQKIQSLSEKEQLQLGQKYFLLPSQCFQSVLSFVTIASFTSNSSSSLTSSSRNEFLKKAATMQPFDIQKSPSGCVRIRVSDEFVWELIQEAKINRDVPVPTLATPPPPDATNTNSRVCTTPQLKKDYTQLVGSRQWKPKLETITENFADKKKKRKLSSLVMNKKKRSHNNNTNNNKSGSSHRSSTTTESQQRLVQSSTSNKKRSSSLKAKIRLRKR